MRSKKVYQVIFIISILSGCNLFKSKKTTGNENQKDSISSDNTNLGLYGGTASDHTASGYLTGDEKYCTGTILKKQCVLTSAQCALMTSYMPYKNPLTITPKKHIPVIRSTELIDIEPGEAVEAFQDLAVLWLANTVYKYPFKDEDNKVYKAAEPWPLVFYRQNYAVGEGDTLHAIGYGPWKQEGGTAIVGGHWQTKGTVISKDVIESDPGNGAYLRTNPVGGSYVCNGDSGGGLYVENKLVAVHSAPPGGATPVCPGGYNKHTLIGFGNETWLNTQMDEFCKPRIDVKVKVGPGGATVIGKTMSATPGVQTINCAYEESGDCSEGPDVYDYELEAFASSGYVFDRWSDHPDVPNCPCADASQGYNPYSSTCHIFVDNYDLLDGDKEKVGCRALFRIPGTPTVTPLPTHTPLPTFSWPPGDPYPTPEPSPSVTPSPSPSP